MKIKIKSPVKIGTYRIRKKFWVFPHYYIDSNGNWYLIWLCSTYFVEKYTASLPHEWQLCRDSEFLSYEDALNRINRYKNKYF